MAAEDSAQKRSGAWDLVVQGQDRKWKAGKGHVYKVTLASDDPKVKLTIESSNPALFQAYPQNEVFTITAKDCEQQQLPEDDED
jgi:hypothetical protein